MSFYLPMLLSAGLMAFVLAGYGIWRRGWAWRRLGWLGLRLLALAAFALGLLEFVELGGGTVFQPPPALAIVTDVSASMAALFPAERQRRTAETLGDTAAILELRGGTVQEWVFAAALAEHVADAPGPAAGATAIGDALLAANRGSPGAAIVLVSDGRENFGESAMLAARQVAALGAKVYPVDPVAAAGEWFDAALNSVLVTISPRAAEFLVVSGIVSLNGRGSLSHATLTLSVDGREIARERLAIPRPANEFQFGVARPDWLGAGWHEYQVAVSPMPRETVLANNLVSGVFEMPGADRVLLLWDRPGPDLRDFRAVFEERYRGRVGFEIANRFAAMPTGGQAAALAGVGLLALGEVAPATLRPETRRLVLDALAAGEMTLIFLHPAALGQWLADPQFRDLIPLDGLGGRFAATEPWTLEKPGMIGLRDGGLPVNSGYELRPRDPRGVLWYATVDGRDLKPVVVADGRVVCLGATGVWRWRLHPERRVRARAELFWREFLDRHGLAPPDKLRLRVENPPTPPGLGAGAERRTFILAEFEGGSADAGATALFRDDRRGGAAKVAEFDLAGEPPPRITVTIPGPGVHWYFAAAGQLRGARVPVVVESDERELADATPDIELLRQLADTTGGRMLDPAESPRELAAEFAAATPPFPVRSGAPPPSGREVPWFALAFAAIAAEWLWRQLSAA